MLKKIIKRLQQLVQFPLPYPDRFSGRIQIYSLYATLGGGFAFAIDYFSYPETNWDDFSLSLIYLLRAGVAYFFACLIIDEYLMPLLPKGWGKHSNRTVGKNWIVQLGIASLFFLCIEVSDLFLIPLLQGLGFPSNVDHFAFWEEYFRILPYLAVIMFIVMTFQKKMNYFYQLQDAKKINQLLIGKHELFDPPNNSNVLSTESNQSKPSFSPEKLILHTAQGQELVELNSIIYIKVKEHSTQLFIDKLGGMKTIYVSTSLKELKEKLPESSFIQTHRSYIGNLKFANRVVNYGGKYLLYLKEDQYSIPISRRRFSETSKKIKECYKND